MIKQKEGHTWFGNHAGFTYYSYYRDIDKVARTDAEIY